MNGMALAAMASDLERAPADPARLQRLFTANYRLVWRLVRRLGLASHLADDAAAQVFLVAAERLADIQPGSERAFVYGTALRTVQTMRRRLAREHASDSTDAGPSPLPHPDELADQKRARDVLDLVLRRMPEDLRTVFVLFEIEGLTTPEIADAAGVPLGTAASRLRRAREKFRELVAEAVPSQRGTP
jgi:RNA polymerase sigma-70 factor, ECF subfamily